MKLQCITLLCAVLVCEQVCSMPKPCHLQWRLVKSAHYLLEKMGGLFPRECLDDIIDIKFPKSVLHSKSLNQKIDTVHKIMEHIDSLFANDTLPESWNAQKADDFQNLVYRITKDHRCISVGSHGHIDDSSSRDRALEIYFEKLATLLRNKDHSLCAWEVIRSELLSVLEFIIKFNSP